MIKTLGLIVGGVFVGAVGVEIIRKSCPEAFGKLYARTRKIASEAKAAFQNGYNKTARTAEPA